MNIIIIGAGTVGSAICTKLAKEGHDITVIDNNSMALTELSNSCDVIGITGSGGDVEVLRDAGADKAHMLIAVTNQDEINILCCAAAKKLGTKHTIARVRKPEYAALTRLMRNEMSLSMTINPDLAAAKEIYRILRFPSAGRIDTLCKGRVELAEFTLAEDSPLKDMTLNQLRMKLNCKFLVCGVLRNGQAHIPSGGFELKSGDLICVTAPEDDITDFFKAAGVYKHPVRDVLISGGGRTTYYLLDMLRRGKIHSTVIEKNKTLCRELAETYDCTVICDNGTKQDLLLQEGLENADAFLSLSDVDEENAIASMYAKTKNVHKIVTMISTLSYIDFFKGVGLESIVSPKSTTTSQILRYVRAMANSPDTEIESLHRMMQDKIEALAFILKDDVEGLTGIPLKTLRLKEGVLLACIVHGDDIIIPSGDDVISNYDTVIVISAGGEINGIKDILR